MLSNILNITFKYLVVVQFQKCIAFVPQTLVENGDCSSNPSLNLQFDGFDDFFYEFNQENGKHLNLTGVSMIIM